MATAKTAYGTAQKAWALAGVESSQAIEAKIAADKAAGIITVAKPKVT